jgi:hypothetical protein
MKLVSQQVHVILQNRVAVLRNLHTALPTAGAVHSQASAYVLVVFVVHSADTNE